eukprot:TRINITY_DN7662_c0_g1_i1.p1 TRINITY_DN7662_c0_g1~~TRINITY_DN7662_c0_g1_i1.p1  ORF type:complete len:473 (-),score=11.19 TRINITY_DN7662_c0_g1_i1:53-1471(-)
MLDMHDTLFTSNPMHLYSSRHSSYIDYSPQTCGIPSYSGYHNIQPALDHLHPYYQGLFDTFSTEYSSGIHSNKVYSTLLSNLPARSEASQLHDITHEFPPDDIFQSSVGEESFLTNSDGSTRKFDRLQKTSNNRNQWNKEFFSVGNRSYHEPTESYQSQKLLSPNGLKFPNNNLDLSYEDLEVSNNQSATRDLSKLIRCMQGRLQDLERQIDVHQGLLGPFLKHLSQTSPKSNSTVDSNSSIPSPKRFCRSSKGNSPNFFEVSNSSGALDSHLEIPCTLSSSISSNCVFPRHSSDHNRRIGMKSLLEELESKLPKENLNGSKLSYATLLLRVGEFAKDLQNQIHVIEKEVSERQSKVDLKLISNLSSDVAPIFRSCPSVSRNSDRFEEYIKERSFEDPKYYVFSTLMRPFFKQFTSTYYLSSKYQFFESLREFSAKSLTVSAMQTFISDALSQFQNHDQITTKCELFQSKNF